jgi:hypothetical protein
MAVITRSDNAEFIAQAYREFFSVRKFNLLKRQVRDLAHNNGQFVRIMRRAGGQYEVVFSFDPGFLLGESMASYFDHPKNLIYCEAINQEEVLCVVINNYSVYIDGKFKYSELEEELALAINAGEDSYPVYVYGQALPLDEDGQISIFDPQKIASFHTLSQSAFENLALDRAVQLFSLEEALQEHAVNKSMIAGFITLFFIIIMVATVIMRYQTPAPPQKAQEDPYQGYKTALVSPAPVQQLQLLKQQLMLTYTLPGWVATEISYQSNQMTLQLHSIGGYFSQLQHWSQKHQAHINLTSSVTELTLTAASLPSRQPPQVIYNAQQVTKRIIDNIIKLLPGQAINVQSIENQGRYKRIQVEISLQQVSPNLFNLICYGLLYLPVVLKEVKLTETQGLFSGRLTLTVLGN